jgi:hypothetical protein
MHQGTRRAPATKYTAGRHPEDGWAAACRHAENLVPYPSEGRDGCGA